MEPIDYWSALRRSWRLLVLFAVLGAIVAVVYPTSHVKHVKSAVPYAATSVVGTPPNSPGSPLRSGVSSVQIVFYATQSATQVAAVQAAGLHVPAAEAPAYLAAAIVPATGAVPVGASVSVKRNTPTNVDLTGYGATPAEAMAVVSAYADQVQQAVDAGLQANQKTASTASSGFVVLRPAIAATRVHAAGGGGLGASRKVRLVGGLVIGAALGAGIVLLIDMLDKRIRSASRVEANFGFPVIVEIPVAPLPGAGAVPELVPVVDVLREPDSPGAEAYRMLRMSVMFENLAPLTGPTDPFALGFDGNGLGQPQPEATTASASPTDIGSRQVVLVASPGTEATRPHVAANLAAVYAEGGQRVVVISTGDLETGRRVHAGFDPSADISVQDVQEQLEPSRLDLVFRLNLSPFVGTSGRLVDRAPAVLDAARTLFDVVIVEVPPILAVHHTEALARLVDVVVVVAECRYTTFSDARQAADLLRRISAPVLGVVFTNVRIAANDVRHAALPAAPADEVHEEAVLVGGAVGAGSEPATHPHG